MTKLDWKNWGIIALAVAFVGLACWGGFVWAFPKTAAWREVCVQGYYNTVYVTNSSCTKDGCSTSTSPQTSYVCTATQWKCFKGRDGTTICRKTRPDLEGNW